jgi:hypothetical protein
VNCNQVLCIEFLSALKFHREREPANLLHLGARPGSSVAGCISLVYLKTFVQSVVLCFETPVHLACAVHRANVNQF